MSTSLIYHAFGIRGYTHVRTEYVGGAVCFHLREPAQRWRCAACGSRDVRSRGGVRRRFRGVPIGSKPVWVTLEIRRLQCRRCGVVRQVEVPVTDGQRRYTKTFARYARELLRHMTIADVAAHLGVSWGVVKEIFKRDLQKRYARPALGGLRLLAIDEIHVGKGQRYLSVVLDLESGAVVFVGDGKGADAVAPFWRRLRRTKARIEAVAVDLSPAYTLAVRTHLPGAVIVYDHFHLVKLLNEKLADLRRELQQKASKEEKQLLKGTRWLLLKRSANLDEERDEKARLERALEINAPLAAAYYLKEEFRDLWRQAEKRAAEAFLVGWIARARSSGIRQLVQFAATLARHREGILAYYDVPISTGPLEGTNNKIKTLQRQAYGFRDREFFKLRIYALHESRYALVG
jgi:transposase